MTEMNDQNLAYQLLNEKYLVNPTKEEIRLCEFLFSEWCKSGNISVLSHLLEFIDSHESAEIRELAIKSLKDHLPKNKEKDVIELWLTHPSPNLRNYVYQIIESSKLDKPILSACYVMLDEWDKFEELDPEYTYLDSYLQTLDPLMGSLLHSRVNQLKSFEYTDSQDEDSIQENRVVDQNILDLIRVKNYDYLWENLLQYPLPFICDLLKILVDEEWKPKNQSDNEFFELLVEYLGSKGWKANDLFKWIAVSKKIGNKFNLLTDLEIRNRDFDLLLNQDIINRPDRVESKKVVYRGKFNLVNSTIDLHLYSETIRKSEIDGKLHIPIYSNNGVELIEFSIPANSLNSFNMDDDGLYFTVRNKSGLYSVDLDVLGTILLPVSRHSEAVIEIIPELIEKANKAMKSTSYGLELISSLHRGREFKLWDLKETIPLVYDENNEFAEKCNCTLGLDIGDSHTKVVYFPDSSCGIELQVWKIPSLIHYISPSEFIIGDEIIDRKLENSTQTFVNWKHGLYPETQRFIRIRNVRISAQSAAEQFLMKLIEKTIQKLQHPIPNAALTYALNLPLSHLTWLRNIFLENGFSNVRFIDELTANVLGVYKTTNERGKVLVIDIGSMKMGAVVASLEGKKSRKRNIDERLREDSFGDPIIIAKTQIDIGSYDITKYLVDKLHFDRESFFAINNLKHKLSFSFEESARIQNRMVTVSIDKTPSEGIDSFYNDFLESDILKSFKVLIRNTIIKATKRGVGKSDIEKLLITGNGANWPLFLEYLQSAYPEFEMILETDNFAGAKGAALLYQNQTYSFNLERDYVFKLVNNGRTNYFSFLSRGEMISQKRKNFEIRKDGNFETLVLDCWSKTPLTQINMKTMPTSDDDLMVGRNNEKLYRMEKVYRDFIPIKENVNFTIGVTSIGHLLYGFPTHKEWSFVETQIYIH